MGLFKKKTEKKTYDKENKKPVLKCSICNGEQVAGFKDIHICKKIDLMREESLVGLQVSGKGNPMNYMPSLNKYCGFNMPGVREQGSSKTQSIEQIQQRYKPAELSTNDTQLAPPKADF